MPTVLSVVQQVKVSVGIERCCVVNDTDQTTPQPTPMLAHHVPSGCRLCDGIIRSERLLNTRMVLWFTDTMTEN